MEGSTDSVDKSQPSESHAPFHRSVGPLLLRVYAFRWCLVRSGSASSQFQFWRNPRDEPCCRCRSRVRQS